MSNQFERVGTLYKKHTLLRELSARAQSLHQVNILLQQSLPPQFKQSCQIVNLSNNKVIIQVESANIASLLRFQANSICNHLSVNLQKTVSELQVNVRPVARLSSPKPINPKQSLVSKNTASLLKSTADNINNDSLKAALYKLASHQKIDN